MAHRATSLFSGLPARLAAAVIGNLTSTRVPYANASKRLVDSANLTFDGTTLTAGGLSLGTGALGRTAQTYVIPAGALGKVGATAGWVVAATDNVNLATVPASQTGSTLVVPIPGLKSGWTITAFYLIGQIESAGGTVTVDADLRRQTAAAADVTDASVATMTQLSVTADTAMTTANTNKGSLSQAVGADQSFYMLITVTTGASTDVALQAIAITVTEA